MPRLREWMTPAGSEHPSKTPTITESPSEGDAESGAPTAPDGQNPPLPSRARTHSDDRTAPAGNLPVDAVADLAARLAALSPADRARLGRLLLGEAAGPDGQP
jgi:hypothetical protein